MLVYSQVVSMKISPEIPISSFLAIISVRALFTSPFLTVSIGIQSIQAEQPLQGKELQEKEAQNIKAYRKSLLKEPTVNRCLLILVQKIWFKLLIGPFMANLLSKQLKCPKADYLSEKELQCAGN